MLTNECIYPLYKADKTRLKFLLDISTSCLFTVPSRFHPVPESFLTKEDKYDEDNMMKTHISTNTIENMKAVIPVNMKGDIDKYIDEKFENCFCEFDVYEVLGDKLYRFVKFIVKNNRFDMTSINDRYNGIEGKNQLYEIRYPDSIERQFKDSIVVYHGSGHHNYHSILRNGLKNMSGTKYMSHGAAMGSGIYLAKTVDLPAQYADGKKIIAVCFLKNSSKYEKGNNVCVCNNDDDLILKYLLCLYDKKNIGNISGIIDNIKKNGIFGKGINMIISKRLDKDQEKLLKFLGDRFISIAGDKRDLTIKFKDNDVPFKLHVVYPADFPIKPMIIRVVGPKLRNASTHGIYLSNLCHPIKWKVNTFLYKIIEELITGADIIDHKESFDMTPIEVINEYMESI
jgi:hypothetical protein